MNNERKILRYIGILYLLGFIAGIFSIAPAIDSPFYLTEAAGNAIQVRLSAFSQFIMAFTYAGVAIMFYPVMTKHHIMTALGFFCFRIIAAVFVIAGGVMLLLILDLSRIYSTVSSTSLLYFQSLGDLLRSCRDLTNHVAMVISVSIGGLLLNISLLRSRLVPAWMAVWGLAGASLAIIASFLVMFRIIDIITPLYLGLNFPVGVQELVFAVWLMVKGLQSK